MYTSMYICMYTSMPEKCSEWCPYVAVFYFRPVEELIALKVRKCQFTKLSNMIDRLCRGALAPQTWCKHPAMKRV